jgi:hypothetical protein
MEALPMNNLPQSDVRELAETLGQPSPQPGLPDGRQSPVKSSTEHQPHISSPSRRKFLGRAGGLGAAAAASALVPLQPLLGGKDSRAEASVISYKDKTRAAQSLAYRAAVAASEAIDLGVLPDNGDAARFTDHSGSWSKVLLHDSLGIVNQASWVSFTKALTSGKFADFENIIVGNPGGTNGTATFNGPQSSFAFDLEGLDSHATNIPPAPSVTSAQTAAEQVEHYWAALLRDTPVEEYVNSPLAASAAADLNTMSYIKSTPNNIYPYPVTAQNLFRGQGFVGDGNVHGPHISQLLLQPTYYGAQQLNQLMQTFVPGQDFLTDPLEYQRVQNGLPPAFSLQFDPLSRFLKDGRSLAAYTHVDALHQAYFTAALILLGIHTPANPGNPYIGSRTEHGFATFGGPDALGTVSEMATRALKAAWFHKWVVNLRQRPEEYGALVHAHITNASPMPQAASVLSADVLNSAGLAATFSKYGTYLLPQAFPEAAPPHPCYPTGHGTVGGACITALKFFFDGSRPIRPLLLAAGTDVMVPTDDGTQLVPYAGADRDTLTINGELSKLAYNISFGHGIHAGIHFRSSTQGSVLLGEQLGLSVLKDRALSYTEPFRITLTKLDGTTANIANH